MSLLSVITPAYLFTTNLSPGLSLAAGPGSGCADEPEQSHMHIERRHQHIVNTKAPKCHTL